MKDTRKIVQGVYSTGSQSVLNEYYRNWARNYDDDVMVRMGYKATSCELQLREARKCL